MCSSKCKSIMPWKLWSHANKAIVVWLCLIKAKGVLLMFHIRKAMGLMPWKLTVISWQRRRTSERVWWPQCGNEAHPAGSSWTMALWYVLTTAAANKSKTFLHFVLQMISMAIITKQYPKNTVILFSCNCKNTQKLCVYVQSNLLDLDSITSTLMCFTFFSFHFNSEEAIHIHQTDCPYL